MRPKGKLFALLAVFAAIGVITGTGAFTTVSAERTATVNVAGDGSALLQLTPYNGPNGYGGGTAGASNGYADIKGGTLEISLNGYNAGTERNSGVNLNARTTVNNVFNITNQGTQDVDVYINTTGDNADLVVFYAGTVETGSSIENDGNAVTLAVGETVTVSMEIDTVDAGLSGGDELVDGITIYANASSS
ncbi:MAG: hypothetical protein SVG88_14435 [Halobacteriales archaeon]|nr:hypothetical protein [Halobacteriales archaeon]